MQIVIDIDDNLYTRLFDNGDEYVADMRRACVAIRKGTPLSKGHGRLKDVDKFLEKVKKDREHEIYLHSWTADMVLERLDSWYAPTIIEADTESEKT